jgi:DtxR family transcriptional regulator, Mn-dependent transcriptional regulator
LKFSITEENYLKAVYYLQVQLGNVSTNALAARLQTKPASITDMMKKLSSKKLLNYKPYYGFSLTTEGKKAALSVIRRHRLWEFFLAKKLNFEWDEVHGIAEELEHVSSKKLIDKLDSYLGFPAFDPHGDPIPDKQGKMKKSNKIQLKDLKPLTPAKVISISDPSIEIIEYLKDKKISIGTQLEVKKIFEFDQSLLIKVASSKTETISQKLAAIIFVAIKEE